MGIFADRLKTAMQRSNVTSAQLAKQTGIGRSSISQWLSSKYVAKHDKVVTLASALEVDPEWLLGMAEQPEPVVATTPAVANVTPAVAPELTAIWEQLTEPDRAKLLKKANKLLEKAAAPTLKHKSKKKKKGKKRKA